MLRLLPLLLVLGLWTYAFIDCLTTPEDKTRNLPKLAWVFVILLFGSVLVGPVAWLVAGRPRRTPGEGPRRGYGRGGFVAPDDNPEFLKSLERNDNEDDDREKD
ncbi:hypothetical protein GCM10027168_60100 [Streptomyces capparidis]